MEKSFFREAKKRVIRYLDENFPTTEEGKMYKEAKRRVKKKKELFMHISVYIPVIIFLAGLSIFLTPGVWWWFLIPAGGWGMAVLIHYLSVFGFPGVGPLDADWEAYQIEKEYFKLKEQKEFEEFLKNKENPEFEEEDGLELKDLEKRYREDDLI